ncbi:hypothetical protein N7457_001040 [Penicillium paradoxum]|uniref:uncharacterized protein n=1 Tax=Penicillium paradoxum TaxID=176176 RepID=UPI002548F33A|nr:uncharacterized protein N7457_001040 [Penicillium paradoxum]KAJ5794441.1 hypothetical protein N7457_001040 [Penicillium paradoxum]
MHVRELSNISFADLRIEEAERVIVQLKELAVPLPVDMIFVTGIHHQEPEALLDNEPTHGCHHRIEDMEGRAAGPRHPLGVDHALLRREILVQHRTNEDDPHQEDFRLEEMKGSGRRPLPKPGAQNLPTVMVGHATHPALVKAHEELATRLLAARSFGR